MFNLTGACDMSSCSCWKASLPFPFAPLKTLNAEAYCKSCQDDRNGKGCKPIALDCTCLVSWIVHETKHSCLLDCSCSFLRWHISLCSLSQALQECFFEFRVLQNWLVCGHNKFQNKTEITLSNESISMKKGGTCMTKENKRHSKVPEDCSLALAVPHLCLFLFPPWSCREIEKTARPVKMAAWSRKDSQSI